MLNTKELTDYHLLVHLLNLKDQNLPPFKEARIKRVNSTRKIINLVKNCLRTSPHMPASIFTLDENDRTNI